MRRSVGKYSAVIYLLDRLNGLKSQIQLKGLALRSLDFLVQDRVKLWPEFDWVGVL